MATTLKKLPSRNALRHDLEQFAEHMGKLHSAIADLPYAHDTTFVSDDMVAINAVEQACRAAIVIVAGRRVS